jgi:CDP-diacylglycerol--glycerol-3-phosphate 3-phosphatidyltransferase/cardiolipin synthase
MTDLYLGALIIFIIASFTDLLDGKIARKYDMVTNFGKIMDPLADKILVYSAFSLMVGDGLIAPWILIIILAREFLMAGMRAVAASEGIVIAADMSGKIKTVLQMIAVPLLILYRYMENSPYERYIYYAAMAFLFASLFMTCYSGIEYVVKNREVFSE